MPPMKRCNGVSLCFRVRYFVCILIKAWWQETLNFWKQIPHVMKFFREEENPDARLPANFMQGFLEVGITNIHLPELRMADSPLGA